jgi:tRNA threonylcarbamoyladenosine biosynthesis protein TsaE
MISSSAEQTKQIAKKFATNLKGGDIVCLYGDLGSGKTTFVKGIAEYFHIKNEVTSPTFGLMQIYKLPKKIKNIQYLAHIDAYRFKKQEEIEEIGGLDYLGNKNCVCLIEWPKKIDKYIKNKKAIKARFEHISEEKRKITLST